MGSPSGVAPFYCVGVYVSNISLRGQGSHFPICISWYSFSNIFLFSVDQQISNHIPITSATWSIPNHFVCCIFCLVWSLASIWFPKQFKYGIRSITIDLYLSNGLSIKYGFFWSKIWLFNYNCSSFYHQKKGPRIRSINNQNMKTFS